jgi:hypothetical protein
MKKIILIAFAAISVCGCKKYEPIDQEPTPEPNHLTAVVNAKTFSADAYTTALNVSGSGLYSLTGTSTVSVGSPTFSFSGKVKTGTYTFGTLPANETQTATYEFNKVKYHAVSGTMVITAIDTLKSLKKLEATFNFKTDTVKGVSYDITEGNIYFTGN